MDMWGSSEAGHQSEESVEASNGDAADFERASESPTTTPNPTTTYRLVFAIQQAREVFASSKPVEQAAFEGAVSENDEIREQTSNILATICSED